MLSLLGNALRFALHPRNWLPFFIADFVFFGALVALILAGGTATIAAVAGSLVNPGFFWSVLATLSGVIALTAVWLLVKVWVVAAALVQAGKERPLAAGFREGRKRYGQLLVALIITGGLTGGAVALGPGGNILALVLSLVFFTAVARTVGAKRGPLAAISESARQLRQRPGRTFCVWFAALVIGVIIGLLFFSPALFYVGYSLFALQQAGLVTQGASGLAMVGGLLVVLLNNTAALLTLAAIFLVGSSVVKAFALKVQAALAMERA